MLLTGAGLAGAGIVRRLARHRDWCLAALEDEGEIVVGGGRLEPGQSVMVARGERRLAADPSGAVAGHIATIDRKHCVLALEISPHAPDDLYIRRPTVPPIEANRVPWPHVGATITVTVTGLSEIYRFSARIRDIQYADDGVRLFIGRPGILTSIQRRRHVRVSLNVPATFGRVGHACHDATGANAMRTSAPIHGTVHNISGSGLRAQVGGILRIHELDAMLQLFAPETIVRIGLPFPSLPHARILARIRSSARAAVRGGLALQITCQFLPMPVSEQVTMIQHVIQLRHGNTWTET